MAEEQQVVKEVDETKGEPKSGKESFSWKRLLTTIAIVVVTAGVVFGVTWYILDKMTREDQEASDKLRVTLQNQIDELRGKLTTGTTATTTAVVDTQKYTNSEFGFQITLPNDWTGYKVLEKKVEGSTQTWYFELPTTDPVWKEASSTNEAGYVSLFAISAFTDSEWDEMINAGGPTDTEIIKIGNYTFGYMGGQAGATDVAQAKRDAVKTIIQTFKVK